MATLRGRSRPSCLLPVRGIPSPHGYALQDVLARPGARVRPRRRRLQEPLRAPRAIPASSTSASSSTAAARTTARSTPRPGRACGGRRRTSRSCCATPSRAIPPRSSRPCAPSPRCGYDLVIGIGFAQTPIVEAVAKDYPKINFAIVDGVSDLPNVASLVFKEHEGSYLVGMIAAHEVEDRRARLRRRHGHPADPQVRGRLRGGGAGGQPEDPGDPELRRRHRVGVEQPRQGEGARASPRSARGRT